MKNKTIPSISIEAQEVIRRLEKTEIGDIVTYGELALLCGGNPQRNKRHVLYTARKRMLLDNQFVFETVMNTGIKRIDDHEIVNTSQRSIKQAHRLSKRAVQKLTCVDFSRLDNRSKILHNAHMSVFGVLAYVTETKHVRKLENTVERLNEKLSLSQTLSFFREKDDT